MKIGIVAPVVYSMPAKKYGGTERVIHGLTEELVKRGHDVTLFASGDTQTSAKLVSVVPQALRNLGAKNLFGANPYTLLNIGTAYKMQDQFDIIHDHYYELSTPTANIARTPVLVTIHGAINEDNKHLYESLDSSHYTIISKAQKRPLPTLNYGGNVYNGLNMEHYPFSNIHEGYLIYVGRISMEKGVHYAIEAAKLLKLPLIIAAKIDPSEEDLAYFHRYIKPQLSPQIRWIGEVDEDTRNKLMSKAICLLHAVTWPEPFGLTLIEAQAVGCPVVAFNMGAIPEIVVHGKTGFVVENYREMVLAVRRINQIKRKDCREHVLNNFNVSRMVDGYLTAYKEVIAKQQMMKKMRQQVQKYKKMRNSWEINKPAFIPSMESEAQSMYAFNLPRNKKTVKN